MANFIRSPKSGSDWGRNELRAYNIVIVPETVATFFGNAQLPPSTISPEPPPGDRKTIVHLMAARQQDTLREREYPGDLKESAVNDFVAHLLRLLGYHEPNRHIRTRKDIPLYMCSADTHAKTDVCVIDRTSNILLLVQEDKQYLEGKPSRASAHR